MKIAVLILGFAITAYSIEWKAWEKHKRENIIVIIVFLLAVFFGVLDTLQTNRDGAYLKHGADSANGQLSVCVKKYGILQDTLNNVISLLRKNKIRLDYRAKEIIIESGFYVLHHDPELQYKENAFIAEQKAAEKQLADKQEAVKSPKPASPQKSTIDESVRKVKLEGFLRDYDGEKTEYIVDSTKRSKYTPNDPLYKQMTGYMQSDRKLMKKYQDSLRKYKK
ncbi:MAG TPA: hypothetical protein VK783_15900 [Bacteroidia bacterium]|jgi:hypothetical protein|nr:hypothetical protein [Bacteroidia bacterium]